MQEQADRVGMPYVNHRWLGGMLTNFTTVSKRLLRLRELREMDRTGRARLPAEEGSDPPAPRARQAPAQPRRHPGPGATSRRGLRDRHEEGAHRRQRGPQAGHPRDRDRRHELRSRRGRLRDPGQRRRDPRRQPGDARRRRRPGRTGTAWPRTRPSSASPGRAQEGTGPKSTPAPARVEEHETPSRRGCRRDRGLHGLRARRTLGCRNGRRSGRGRRSERPPPMPGRARRGHRDAGSPDAEVATSRSPAPPTPPRSHRPHERQRHLSGRRQEAPRTDRARA